MTASRGAATLPVESIDEAIEALRSRGLRVSAARRLVLEALFSADGPLSAKRIADGLAGRLPESDVASVYRNLETFEELGLVRHMHVGHGPTLYALAHTYAHEYIVCERCDDVAAYDPAALDGVRASVLTATGFHVRFDHFPLAGLCPTCLAERAVEG